jgi:hypothetical protein
MYTAETFVLEPSASEIQVAIEKLRRYKSPGVAQFPTELIKAGGQILRSEVHTLIKFILKKEELTRQWKLSVMVPIHEKVIKIAAVIIKAYYCYQFHTKIYPTFFCLG